MDVKQRLITALVFFLLLKMYAGRVFLGMYM
jgi:hypothetical protein